MPVWAAHIVALLILLMIETVLTLRRRRARPHPANRRPRGNEVARVRRRCVTPEDPATAALSRAIRAFFDGVASPDSDPVSQPRDKTPPIIPGVLTADTAATPPATSSQSPRLVLAHFGTGPPTGQFCYA